MTLSIRLALLAFLVGFAVEGATEAYQLLAAGYLHQGWIGFYYLGLATTGAGFYLIYRGRHEWTELHRRSVRHSHRFLWAAVALFAGATVAIAGLGTLIGGTATVGPPLWVGWVAGGLVTLALGNFFLSLVLVVYRLVGRWGRTLAVAAFAWALGVAVLTGSIVSDGFLTLFHEFLTNPLGLVVSFAPLAFVMAPLFVAYFLFVGAYADAYRHVTGHLRNRGAGGTSAASNGRKAPSQARTGVPPPSPGSSKPESPS